VTAEGHMIASPRVHWFNAVIAGKCDYRILFVPVVDITRVVKYFILKKKRKVNQRL
jgi:hypothetical protein